MSIITRLQESTEKHHVLAFGRMNPVTSGHEAVVNKLHDVASDHNAGHTLVVSHTQDAKKNPLTAKQKVKHAQRAFPGTHVITASSSHPTILHHASELHKQGVTHLHVIAGSDRVPEMKALLHKYNGVKGAHGHYNFKKITVHSAGARDPDAEGTTGMSASKMRAHAAAGNKEAFHAGAPSKMSTTHKEEMYHDVRKGMGLKEVFDPHLKISKYQWGEKKGTNQMKKITPGEEPDKLKEMFTRIKQIPYLLMTEEQKQHLIQPPKNQLEFDGVETKYFNMCPTAYKLFNGMIETIRAGKHIGEIAGHQPQQVVTQNTDAIKSVQAGMALKPEHIRQMQFRQYTGL
jgi:hypothetical protein